VLQNLIYRGLKLCLGGLSPQKPPRGDETGSMAVQGGLYPTWRRLHLGKWWSWCCSRYRFTHYNFIQT